jgi:4-diphosphocytidyl-2-C-methyl-D-erythritol kinase
VSDAPWPAPAKLNLFLHVTGRRPDGYHELQTLFQLVDLEDRLYFRVRRDGVIARSGTPTGWDPADDLAVRAAAILRTKAANFDLGVDIVVEKHIPVGGGMGGGSSDAATTLVALNALWGLRFSTDRLAGWGLELGADVPLFVRGYTALARGVGEHLEPADVPPAAFAIVFPGVAAPTAEAFQAPELTRNSPVITIPGFLSSDWYARALPGRNDLEPVVAARHPAVRAALEWLGARGAARLTGSGACVFAAFGTESGAHAALAGLPADWTGMVARGLARSPLAARAAAEQSEAR